MSMSQDTLWAQTRAVAAPIQVTLPSSTTPTVMLFSPSTTPELLITGSTGISRPLGDPAKIAQYLAGDQETRLRRRLESDVKSLFALYNYGLLHRRVRLRWGFLNDDLGVAWAEPGDPSLHDVLKEGQASRREIEIVYGSAPGWSDPWSRSIRARILSLDFTYVTVESSEKKWTIPRDEIQAIRVVE